MEEGRRKREGTRAMKQILFFRFVSKLIVSYSIKLQLLVKKFPTIFNDTNG